MIVCDGGNLWHIYNKNVGDTYCRAIPSHVQRPLAGRASTTARGHLHQKHVGAIFAARDSQLALTSHFRRVVAYEACPAAAVAAASIARRDRTLDAEQIGLPAGPQREGDGLRRRELCHPHRTVHLDLDGHFVSRSLGVSYDLGELVAPRGDGRSARTIEAAIRWSET